VIFTGIVLLVVLAYQWLGSSGGAEA